MKNELKCPNCDSVSMSIFYEIQNVPVHSMLLLQSRKEALDFPTGNIALGFCQHCGFVSNAAFDPELVEYSSRYESSQAFSRTFSDFYREQATNLIEQYDLHNKDILEIGCGQGEFLKVLCELGENRGVGFDPAFDDTRGQAKNGQIDFVKDFYSEKYACYHADFVCCKMTLEHIPDTANFVRMVRNTIGDSPDTLVFFQVPDAERILGEAAFWDIYYEHCSYFTLESLARVFVDNGFIIVDLRKEFGDQYLRIVAKPIAIEDGIPDYEYDLESLAQGVRHFSANWQRDLAGWRQKLKEFHQSGQRTVIWGASSKGVSFLNTLDVGDEIELAVDINPYKQGTYIPGTGQMIVAPEYIREYKPDIVVVMNPIYANEIKQNLEQMGIRARILSI